MDTSKSKLPVSYLGIRGYANTPKNGEKTVNKNALPILTYFDLFKNYYANTQEENFYMIGGSPVIKAQINGENIPNNNNIPSALGEITSTSAIILSPKTLTKEEIRFRVKTSVQTRQMRQDFITQKEFEDAQIQKQIENNLPAIYDQVQKLPLEQQNGFIVQAAQQMGVPITQLTSSLRTFRENEISRIS